MKSVFLVTFVEGIYFEILHYMKVIQEVLEKVGKAVKSEFVRARDSLILRLLRKLSQRGYPITYYG